jgi:GrpB-like predicted nucleotidyltransferase (UPF0157 family)
MRFEAAAEELRLVFTDASIEHVGSTSVPGLCSKDTIDIVVGVGAVAPALTRARITLLAEHGFEYVPTSFAGDPDHAFFHRIVEDHRTEHVHVMRTGSPGHEDHLLFRDYLRTHPDAVARYEAAKRDLADRFARRRDDYLEQKQAVVEALMVEARAWQHAAR